MREGVIAASSAIASRACGVDWKDRLADMDRRGHLRVAAQHRRHMSWYERLAQMHRALSSWPHANLQLPQPL
ncbi:hypothetical protein [Gemmatimonas sp.]|uniref:hypothetical protein n=1 Tax=Gemmatimonas sp. TaxID=1962908 RepID=UPI00286CC16C|nr:hypothetical protein [Gemmatimonas sp.]